MACPVSSPHSLTLFIHITIGAVPYCLVAVDNPVARSEDSLGGFAYTQLEKIEYNLLVSNSNSLSLRKVWSSSSFVFLGRRPTSPGALEIDASDPNTR